MADEYRLFYICGGCGGRAARRDRAFPGIRPGYPDLPRQGEFFAVANQCSHALAKLEDGKLRAYRLICPLHGAAFDIRDGTAKGKPATRPIRTYPVRVIDERIEIRIEPDRVRKPGPGSAEG